MFDGKRINKLQEENMLKVKAKLLLSPQGLRNDQSIFSQYPIESAKKLGR